MGSLVIHGLCIYYFEVGTLAITVFACILVYACYYQFSYMSDLVSSYLIVEANQCTLLILFYFILFWKGN